MAASTKPTTAEKTLLELSSIKASINNLVKAVDRHSANTGKWLAAVAKAASTPQDNSTEVQAEIDKITAEINANADKEAEALKSVKGD